MSSGYFNCISKSFCFPSFIYKFPLFHLSRCLSWRLSSEDVKITSYELSMLNSIRGDNNNNKDASSTSSGDATSSTMIVLRAYMVWRRSALIVALPSLFSSSVLGVTSIPMELVRQSGDGLNMLGQVARTLPEFIPTILAFACGAGLVFWKRLKFSQKLCRYALLFSLIAPLWPALIPTDYLYLPEYRSDKLPPTDAFILKISDGIMYLIQIMPLIVTIPNGVIKGSLRIRGLLPYSSIAGWICVFTAPFLSLLLYTALIFLTQMAGTILLVVGATLLTISPILYVAFYKLYTQSLSDEEEQKLTEVQRIIGLCQLLGFIIVLIWVFTFEEYGIRIIGPTTEHNNINSILLAGSGSGSTPSSVEYTTVSSSILDGNYYMNSGTPPPEVVLLSYTSGFRIIAESIGRNFFTILVVADTVLNMTLIHWYNYGRAQLLLRNDDELSRLYSAIIGKKNDETANIEMEEMSLANNNNSKGNSFTTTTESHAFDETIHDDGNEDDDDNSPPKTYGHKNSSIMDYSYIRSILDFNDEEFEHQNSDDVEMPTSSSSRRQQMKSPSIQSGAAVRTAHQEEALFPLGRQASEGLIPIDLEYDLESIDAVMPPLTSDSPHVVLSSAIPVVSRDLPPYVAKETTRTKENTGDSTILKPYITAVTGVGP